MKNRDTNVYIKDIQKTVEYWWNVVFPMALNNSLHNAGIMSAAVTFIISVCIVLFSIVLFFANIFTTNFVDLTIEQVKYNGIALLFSGVLAVVMLIVLFASIPAKLYYEQENNNKNLEQKISEWNSSPLKTDLPITIFKDPLHINPQKQPVGIWVENPVTGKTMTNLHVTLDSLIWVSDDRKSRLDRTQSISSSSRSFNKSNVDDILLPIHYGKSNRRLVYIAEIQDGELAFLLNKIYDASRYSFEQLSDENPQSDLPSYTEYCSRFEIKLLIDANVDNLAIETVSYSMWVEFGKRITHWQINGDGQDKKIDFPITKMWLLAGEISEEINVQREKS